MGGGLLQGLVLLTERGDALVLSTLLSPVTLLLMLLAQSPNGTLQLCSLFVQWILRPLRFRRVLVGQVVAGLKATERGLLSGHTPGIGESSAGKPLSSLTSIGV